MRKCTRRGGSPTLVGALAIVATAALAVTAGGAPPKPWTGRFGSIPPLTADGPLRFQDLSNASGGPVDFGSPRSDVEKSACAFLDADGDGWDDLVTLTGTGQAHGYFVNRPDGSGGRRFVPAPPGNGLDDGPAFERDGASLTAGDVDGDGDEDLYVGNGWNSTLPAGTGRNLLLLNNGYGRFADAAESLGLADGDNTTAACVLFDMDLDGDLDLLSCNSRFPENGKDGDGLSHLFRNTLAEDGALGFVEETAERGLAEVGVAVWNVLATDYDGDGDADVVIGHDQGGLTQLLRNDGTGRFTDVTTSSGAGAGDDSDPSTFGDDSAAAMGAAVADVENDGDLDLYVSNAPDNPLYVNRGDGTFTELARSRGVAAGTVGWGVTFEDFDLDGFVDLYVAGGDFWDNYDATVRDWLYLNRGDGRFTEVWTRSGMRHDPPLHRKNGTASADIDRDGRIDLLVTRAERQGASPYLYRNVSDTHGRHWLAVRLAGDGAATNRSAIGAKVRVFPIDASGKRIAGLAQIREVQGASSRGSRSSLVQHFGLGPDAVRADVEVEWPRAGDLASRRVLFTDVAVDRVVKLSAAPQVEHWRLVPEASVDVADLRPTDVPCAGEGVPDPLTRIAVESGPAWLAAGPWREGRFVRLEPPRVEGVFAAEASIVARTEGAAPGTESRQKLSVRVVPAPSIERVRGPAGRSVRVRGDHLDVEGLVVTIDGAPCEVRSVRTRRRAGGRTEQRAVVRFPAAMRRDLARGRHELRVVEPVAGFEAAAEL